MLPRIVALSGKMRSGKDTIANVLCESFGYTKIAFANKLRQAVYALDPVISGPEDEYCYLSELDHRSYEYIKENYPEFRRLLQAMGTEVGRNLFGENFWVDQLVRTVKENPETRYVITDCRFPNEAIAAQDALQGVVIRVVREGNETTGTHPSETALDEWAFPCYILNNGTVEELVDAVKKTFMRYTNENNPYPTGFVVRSVECPGPKSRLVLQTKPTREAARTGSRPQDATSGR